MPGPTTISDTEVAGMLKRLYDNLSVDFFPLATVLLAQIKKGGPGGLYNMRWGGAGVYYNAIVGSPVGLTASASGYLPPDAVRTEIQGNIDIARLYVRRQVDMKLIVGTTSKAMAYRAIGQKVVGEAKAAYRRGLQRYAHGDATGKLAVIGTVNSTTSIVVSAPNGVASSGQGALFLGVGQYIGVIDASDSTTVLGKATITAITTSGDNSTLTLSAAIAGMAATDWLVGATTNDTEHNAVPNGLVNITNRGGSYASLHNVSATTYPETAPTRMVAGTDTDSTSITEVDLWELIMRVAGKSGNDARDQASEFLVLTTPGLLKALALSFFGGRDWTMAPKKTLNGGFQAVEIMGVNVVSDSQAPAGTVYLLHLPSLTWIDAKDFGVVTHGDAGVWRWVTDRDAYETSYSHFVTLGAPQRHALGSITGFTDAGRYTHV
jgi:hypothetical protein